MDKFFNVVKNSKYNRKFPMQLLKSYSPFFDSKFSLENTRLLDSYFQLRKNLSGLLSILFPDENFHGLLISYQEILRLIFRVIIPTNFVFLIIFNKIKKFIQIFLVKSKYNLSLKKIEATFTSFILRRK